MREIKYRLRKRHGISPDKALMEKGELVKLLVDAEKAAIAKNVRAANAGRVKEEKQADAVRDFLMKAAAAVLGIAVMVTFLDTHTTCFIRLPHTSSAMSSFPGWCLPPLVP